MTRPWLEMERDADLLHAACLRDNEKRRNDEKWDRILFLGCAGFVIGLVAYVTWWLSYTPGVTP